MSGHPWHGVAAALSFAYFLLAFRSPDVAWMLVWVAFPLSVELVFLDRTAIKVPTEPMIALALGAWGLRSVLAGRLRLKPSPLHLPLAALFCIALLSTAMGRYQGVGVKALVVTAGYVAFGYLYQFMTPCDPARRERWVRLALGMAALMGLYGAVRVLAGGVGLHTAFGLARPFFTEHGTYGAYLAMMLPAAILYMLERSGRVRAGYALAAFLITLGIALSLTRAAWLSLVVVLPVAVGAWIRWRASWRPLLAPLALALAVATVIAGAGAFERLTRHAGSVVESESVSTLERMNRWLAALEMARDRPYLGVGYGAYSSAYPEYRRKSIVTEEAFQHMGPHSEPLRLLSEMGVVGLAAGLWFLATAGWVGVRAVRHASDPGSRLLALAVLAGLSTYVVHGIFNSYLGNDKVTVPLWTGLGILAALDRG